MLLLLRVLYDQNLHSIGHIYQVAAIANIRWTQTGIAGRSGHLFTTGFEWHMELTQPFYKARWLSDIEIPLVSQFYRMQGFRGKARRHEICAVVRNEKRGGVVACGYLRKYEAFRLLSGVAVASEQRSGTQPA